MNPACRNASSCDFPLQRGQTNQPDLAFPQSPGIIPRNGQQFLGAVRDLGAFNELMPRYFKPQIKSMIFRRKSHIAKHL